MGTEANQCDLNCPVKALMGIEVREHPSRMFSLAVEGVKQMGYAAAVCASRGASTEENWRPSDRCIEKAGTQAEGLRPFNGTLSGWETKVLGRIGLGSHLEPTEQPPQSPEDPQE